MAQYAHPEVLLTTDWVAEHLDDDDIRLVEVDVNTTMYDKRHIPGAISFNWETQLCDQVYRDIIDKEQFAELMSHNGISNNTRVVLYGDNNNWFAAYCFWLMEMYGHEHLYLMNGGRKKWEDEGRIMTTEKPKIIHAVYKARNMDSGIRADRGMIFQTVKKKNRFLVDVRSREEYTGEVIAPPGMTETAQRGGHIPGAINVPWSMAVNEDGTFKSKDELVQLYETTYGMSANKEAIAYCRIGERSSHTWFVLKYLMGYHKVRNYDGSWTEWGNLISAPIEK